jgi:hypothetical protein
MNLRTNSQHSYFFERGKDIYIKPGTRSTIICTRGKTNSQHTRQNKQPTHKEPKHKTGTHKTGDKTRRKTGPKDPGSSTPRTPPAPSTNKRKQNQNITHPISEGKYPVHNTIRKIGKTESNSEPYPTATKDA